MENGPFTDDFPNKTSIYNGFSIAMLNYQRVLARTMISCTQFIINLGSSSQFGSDQPPYPE